MLTFRPGRIRGRVALRAALATAVALLAVPAAVAAAGSGGLGPDGDGGDIDLSGVPRAYERFANLVTDRTDLSIRVVGAWALAEGGPNDNPLNIGPGREYGSPAGAARATARVLHTPIYAPILASALRPDRTQIRAIARSSWCPACGRRYLRLLRIAYRRVAVVG